MKKLSVAWDQITIVLMGVAALFAIGGACILATNVAQGTSHLTQAKYAEELELGVTSAMFTLGFALVVARLLQERPSHKELQDEIKQLRETVDQLKIAVSAEKVRKPKSTGKRVKAK